MQEENQNVFALPERITISECQDLFLSLKEKMNSEGKLVLDASNVKKIDTAGMQLLASLFKDSNENKEVMAWHGVSEELQESAKYLGLSVHLNVN